MVSLSYLFPHTSPKLKTSRANSKAETIQGLNCQGGKKIFTRLRFFCFSFDDKSSNKPSNSNGNISNRSSRKVSVLSLNGEIDSCRNLDTNEENNKKSEKKPTQPMKEYVFGKNLSMLPIDFLLNKKSNLKVDPEVIKQFLHQKPKRQSSSTMSMLSEIDDSRNSPVEPYTSPRREEIILEEKVLSAKNSGRRKSSLLDPDNLESIMDNQLRLKLVSESSQQPEPPSPLTDDDDYNYGNNDGQETFFEYNDFCIKEEFTNGLILHDEDEVDLQERIVSVLESRRGRQTFSTYMQNHLSHDSFSFFQGAHVVLMLDVEDVVEMAVTIAVDYMSVEAEKNPENFRIDATEALKQLKSPEEDVMLRVFQDLASAQKEVVKMIVMGSLTKFILSSEEYKVWLEEESSVSYRSYNNSARILDLQGLDYTPSMSPERSSSPERYVINDLAFQKASLRRSLQKPSRRPSITGSSEPGQIIEETFHQRPNSRRGSRRISAFRGLLQQQHLQRLQRPPVEDNGEGNLTSKAIANFEQGILDASLVHNKWLTSLIQCCEHLPLSMSIASASPSKPGFPLIYVNQNFMKIAGYEKSEIIGRNCRFLQDETAEKESIQLMRTALREAKPVKVYITNVTKDGKHFRNLLAMKPLFDQHGRYRYVLGCQFSLSNNGLFNHSNFILLSQILKIFPDTIVSAPHEEDGNW